MKKLYYNSNYLVFLEHKISKRQIYVDNVLIKNIDAIRLLKNFVSVSIIAKSGKIFLNPKVSDFIVHNEIDNLHKVIKRIKTSCTKNNYLIHIESYLGGHMERAKKELDRYAQTILTLDDFDKIIKSYYFLFGDRRNTKKYFDIFVQKFSDISAKLIFARLQKEVYDDENKTKEILEQLKKKIVGEFQWRTEFTRSWSLLLNDRNETMKWLKKDSNSLDIQLENALTYLMIFNDIENAKKILIDLERKHVSIELATSWKLLFNNDAKIKKILSKITQGYRISNKLMQIEEYIKLARAWKDLHGNDSETKKCLLTAIELASGSSDWESLFYACFDILGDKEEAKKMIIQWEKKCNIYYDWKYLAKAWKCKLNDNIESIRLIKVGEKNVESGSEYSELAILWNDLFDDKKKARKYLVEGMKSFKNKYYDWIDLAEAWGLIYGSSANNKISKCLSEVDKIEPVEDDWYYATKYIELSRSFVKKRKTKF